MQKGLYIKSKGLSIAAGIIMAVAACLYFGGNLHIFEFETSIKPLSNPQTYRTILELAAMLAFTLMALLPLKKNIAWVAVPAALFLLLNGLPYSVYSFNFSEFIQAFSAYDILQFLLLLAAAVLLLIYAVNPKMKKTALIILLAYIALRSMHYVFTDFISLLHSPAGLLNDFREYRDALQQSFWPVFLQRIYNPLRYLPLLLLILSFGKKDGAQTAPSAAAPAQPMLQKGLFVRAKGLSISAGIIMAFTACLYLGYFLLGLKEYTTNPFTYPMTYVTLLEIAAMFAFAVMAILLVNRNMTWILIPATVLLLRAGLWIVLSIRNTFKNQSVFSAASLCNLLLVLAVLVLLYLYAANPKMRKTALVILIAYLALRGLHPVFRDLQLLVEAPAALIKQYQEIRASILLNYFYTPLRYVPLLLLVLSFGRRERVVTAQATEALPEQSAE